MLELFSFIKACFVILFYRIIVCRGFYVYYNATVAYNAFVCHAV